jgi:predicted nucleic acid-binding protein
VAQSAAAGLLRVVWTDARAQREAWSLMESRPATELSLTDCTSAVLARRNKVKRIFGFDDDFAALGFEVIPA